MVKGRHCSLKRLHVPIRQLCELFCHDEQLFRLQFQHPLNELARVVELLERHNDLGLVEFFSLFDNQERFVAHFRIDILRSDNGLLGFHGGSFMASPNLGRVFVEGSLLLLEATLATYGWTHVLSNCLTRNLATAHFLLGLGFQRGYVARSQRLLDGHPVDVAHFYLSRDAYLANRLRQRLVCDKPVASLSVKPAKRTNPSTHHSIAAPGSLHCAIMESCRGVLNEVSNTANRSRTRYLDEHNVSRYLSGSIHEILENWEAYTGMDGRPEGLEQIVEAWSLYTSVMLLLPLCALDDARRQAIAFFVIRLFPGNDGLAEIAGGGLGGADPASFASDVRMLLDQLICRTGLCRIQARERSGTSTWQTHLGFTKEGCDCEGNTLYSLVSGDIDASC